jgi:hypothetical protein
MRCFIGVLVVVAVAVTPSAIAAVVVLICKRHTVERRSSKSAIHVSNLLVNIILAITPHL